MISISPARRDILRLMGGAAAIGPLSLWSMPLLAASSGRSVGDARLRFDFDDLMRSRVALVRDGNATWLSRFGTSETLRLADGRVIDRFVATGMAEVPVADDIHGSGREYRLAGLSSEGIEKTVTVRFFDRHPGFALMRVRFRNAGDAPMPVAGWSAASHVLDLPATGGGAWTFAGSSHADRRDWIQPVGPDFDQRNFMGMNASDYGGGTPCSAVWARTGGIAVGHVERVPRLIALPVTATRGGVRVAAEAEVATGTPRAVPGQVANEKTDGPTTIDIAAFAPGTVVETPELFVTAGGGDCFGALAAYGRVMTERGVAPAAANPECFEPNWCAWGYERDFTAAQVIGTLPKVRELGFRWAVIDDGWQTAEGDWYLDPRKFPGGDADMAAMVREIRAAGLKPKLWIAPLAVDPGTDLLRHNTDMLLLDENGAVQDVTWWNAFYLCPAYQPTIDKTIALVAKIFGEWGFAGLKIDGQHLNGVAPCYNPAHDHADPNESIEGLQRFWRLVYEEAARHDPDAVIELCPCGTSYSYHNMIGQNQTVASDPLSSWQIRLKGKVIRALAGGQDVAYSGDHVELSDGGTDFASTIAIGAVPFSKFTWPVDPKLKDSFLLTPEREVVWRRWLDLYAAHMLPRGRYRGELYDIGFDRPEAHAIEKDGALYYGFFATRHEGAVELRGLNAGTYRVRDLHAGRDLGTVSAAAPRLSAPFDGFLFLEARQVQA